MENKYTIEQMSEVKCFFSFSDVNEKGEELIIELTKCINSSFPVLWEKNGYIDRVLESFWGIQTHVKDTEGNTFGIYNPQHTLEIDEDGRKRSTIDFNWIFEATEVNGEKLINKVYQLFSSARGITATEEKNKKILEYAIKNNTCIYKEMPQGWDKLIGCLTAPEGTVMISNMKSLKSGKRKKAILLVD